MEGQDFGWVVNLGALCDTVASAAVPQRLRSALRTA